MANITYVFTVRDNSGSNAGLRMTGLTPTFVHLKKLSDNSNVSQPAITEVGQGQYKFSYDVDTTGEATGQIDAGGSLTDPGDRYIDILLAHSAIKLDQQLDASPWNITVLTALKAAWTGFGFAKSVKSGTTQTLYAPDDSTVAKAFTLDQSVNPNSRS